MGDLQQFLEPLEAFGQRGERDAEALGLEGGARAAVAIRDTSGPISSAGQGNVLTLMPSFMDASRKVVSRVMSLP